MMPVVLARDRLTTALNMSRVSCWSGTKCLLRMTPDWVAIRSASAHQSPEPVPFEPVGGVADGVAAEVVAMVPGGVPPDVPEAPGDLSQPASTATASAPSTPIVAGMRTPFLSEMGEGYRRLRLSVLPLPLAAYTWSARARRRYRG